MFYAIDNGEVIAEEPTVAKLKASIQAQYGNDIADLGDIVVAQKFTTLRAKVTASFEEVKGA